MLNCLDKYCIIGGGACGIAMGKSLKKSGISFQIFEREDDFGGNWYMGRPCSKMYRSAHLISSKLNTQFSDFPMPKQYPAYPNHQLMLSYLRSVAKHFDLYSHTVFNTGVEKIEPYEEGWRVKLSTKEERLYKGIIVANGLMRERRYPSYPGEFKGIVMHSEEYKDFDMLKNKNVLIVGGGNSGCDISVDITRSAKKVFHSMRRGYHYMPKFIEGKPTQNWLMETSSQFNNSKEYWAYVKKTFKLAGFDGVDYGLPVPDHDIHESHPIMNSQILYHIGHGDIIPKPDIKRLKPASVIFQDGTEEEVEVIIYATGYKTSFPFLESQHLTYKAGFPDLYAYVFHKTYDNLVFIGYASAPAGLGNLANIISKLLVSYLRALEVEQPFLKTFRAMRLGQNPDLGNDNYYQSDRHVYELDLWKTINFMNQLWLKFEVDKNKVV